MSQADATWIQSSYFLSWDTGETTPARTTLVCFGATYALEERFAYLYGHPAWLEVVRNPFDLYAIVLEELYKILDDQVWNLSAIFRTIERGILRQAESRDLGNEFDFVGLHNVSKHIAFLTESTNATLLVVDDMLAQHAALQVTFDQERTGLTAGTLVQRRSVFKSTSLRLASLERRMQGIVNLAFNLVTQRDSRIVQRNSDSMKTIAAVTLFFLPISTVATICGSQFFNFDSDGPNQGFQVSRRFWIFWAIAIPTTVVVMCSWYLYHKWTVHRFLMKTVGRRL